MQHTSAHALFVLGDLFEVWVGDDCLDDPDSFEAHCVDILRKTSARLPVYVMQGNRDFLLGPQFAHRSGVALISDPFTLSLTGERVLLTHGDSLCVDDVDYQAFRRRVRAPQWQQDFLSKPLTQRLAIAAGLRSQSEDKKKSHPRWVDVDTPTALQALSTAHATTLVHGHTHQPATHAIGADTTRHVLSDWCMQANPFRAEVLRIQSAPNGLNRQYLRLAPEACH